MGEYGNVFCKEHGIMDAQCCMCIHKTIAQLEAKLERVREFIEMAVDNVGHHVCDAARQALKELSDENSR